MQGKSGIVFRDALNEELPKFRVLGDELPKLGYLGVVTECSEVS
jgi:hypothetical protein